MHQVEYGTERRGLRADGSGPLPQFDLTLESFDPDRTLERRFVIPALTSSQVSGQDRAVAPADPGASEFDLGSTVEIIPELSVDDILESSPRVDNRPPLVLPPPASVPFDLDRLLARARSETSRSPEFFRASTPTPTPLPVAFDFLTPAAATPAVWQTPEVPLAIPMTLPLSRGPFRWLLGTAVAAVVSTLAVAAVQSRDSSARSPESVPVTKPLASTLPASVQPASTPASFEVVAADAPSVSVQSLPRVEAGTISLAAVAASHRLFVDGKLAESGSAVVACGTHVVQVGSKGTRRYIDVPCGQEIVLAR